MFSFGGYFKDRFDPVLFRAAHMVGVLPPEGLPEIAQRALERGFDGPSIRFIAALNGPTLREISHTLSQFFDELGTVSTSQKDAALTLSRAIAEDICEGRLDPYEGANVIWRRIYHKVGEPVELLPFVGLGSEYEDNPYLRTKLAADIVEAAKSFCAKVQNA
ncbi:MAG: hypothetical protein LAN64_08575 [Acidobacteriia bacterium]|nr:hypothetical protein [Terriglobia bacterium]